MPIARRMTAREFEVVLSRMANRRVSERSLEAARLALVDGLTMQAVAERMGMNNRQAVFSAVCCAWKELKTHRAFPCPELAPTPKVEIAPGVLRHTVSGCKPKPTPRRMTPEVFERVRDLMLTRRRFSAARLEAARLALVEGFSFQSVAARLKLNNRQLVYSVVQGVWEERETLRTEEECAGAVSARPTEHWWPRNSSFTAISSAQRS